MKAEKFHIYAIITGLIIFGRPSLVHWKVFIRMLAVSGWTTVYVYLISNFLNRAATRFPAVSAFHCEC